MNFQTVRQIMGQKDGRGYAQQVDLFAVLLQIIDGPTFSPNQTPIWQVLLCDDTGEQQRVSLLKRVPGSECLNTRQAFSLSAKTYQNAVQYSGFWQDKKDVRQGVQQPAPPQQAAPPQQQAPPPQSNVVDNALRSNMRRDVVCAFIQSGNAPEIDSVEYWVEYIMTGQVPARAQYEGDGSDFPG